MQLRTHTDQRPAPRRCRGDEGAAMVEAAFVTPVFLLILFAILEFGTFMKDELTVTNGVRSGARAGIAPSAEAFSDWEILQAINAEIGALDHGVERIVVYDAEAAATLSGGTNFFAEPVPAGCVVGVKGLCNVYDDADLTISKANFALPTYLKRQFWPGEDREYSRTAGTSYMGVFIEYEHEAITKFFFDVAVIGDEYVMRVEPRIR